LLFALEEVLAACQLSCPTFFFFWPIDSDTLSIALVMTRHHHQSLLLIALIIFSLFYVSSASSASAKSARRKFFAAPLFSQHRANAEISLSDFVASPTCNGTCTTTIPADLTFCASYLNTSASSVCLPDNYAALDAAIAANFNA
jgi:hypothetical protein